MSGSSRIWPGICLTSTCAIETCVSIRVSSIFQTNKIPNQTANIVAREKWPEYLWPESDPYCKLGTVTYVFNLRTASADHIRLVCNYRHVKVCRMRAYVCFVLCCVVLWCNVWMMNVLWWRLKSKPGASISLLFSKSTKGTPGLTSTSDGLIAINTTYFFRSYPLRGDLGINPGIFGTETSDWGSASPSLLAPGRNILN